MSDLPDLKSLWDYHDPAATEARFREILPASKSDPAYHVELLTQIARTHSLRRQFTEAHALLDEAEALLTPRMFRPRVRCLLERGRAHNSAGNRQPALLCFDSAHRLAKEQRLDFFAVDAAHMIAIAHPDPKEQLKWNLETIHLVESSVDQSLKPWLGPMCNNVGWTYHEHRDYVKALHFLELAQVHHDRFGDARAKFVARWSVAKLLRLNARVEESGQIQRTLESEMVARNEPDGFVYEELGELKLLAGQAESAREYFKKAYELLQKIDWLVESEPARLQRIRNLGLQPPSSSAR